MRLFDIGKYCSLIYLLINLLASLFWPLNDVFFFENLLFFPALLFTAYVLIATKPFSRKIAILLIIVFLVFLLIELIHNQTIVIQHILYLLRWLKYAVLFSLAYYFYQLFTPKTSLLIFKGLFLILAGINVFILLNFLGTGEALQYFFSPKENFLISNFYEPGVLRLGGTMMNPNDNAMVFSVFALFFTLHRNFKDYYFAFFAIVLLLLTQSRTAIVILIAIGLLLTTYKFIFAKVSKKQVFVFLTISVVFFAFISLFNMSYLNTVFTGKAFESNSVSVRMVNFFNVVNSPTEVLIWGNGVILDQIAIYGKYLDSEITVVIAQFGVFGLFVWLIFIGTLLFFGFKKNVYSTLWISLVLLFLGAALTNLSFLSTQLGVFLFIVLGFANKQKMDIIQK
jgi:hypothetical protein